MRLDQIDLDPAAAGRIGDAQLEQRLGIERGLGEAFSSDGFEVPVVRERVKVVSRDEQVEISRSGALIES